MKKILILFVLIALVFSCNKEKRFSKRLQKGETWLVQEIKINDAVQSIGGTWEITNDTDIYEEVPQLNWTAPDTLNALLEWQFQDKGKTFLLNYFISCDNCDGSTLEDLDYFAYQVSGTYDVEQHKRKEMKFVSKNLPNTNAQVEIKIVRKD